MTIEFVDETDDVFGIDVDEAIANVAFVFEVDGDSRSPMVDVSLNIF